MTHPENQMDGYAEALKEATAAIVEAQSNAVLALNRQTIGLYWRLGRLVLDRQARLGWGSKVIERLSNDLGAAFPSMRGLSVSNLHYMRRTAEAWPDENVCLAVVGNLAWGHVRALLDKLDSVELRGWYAAEAVEYGWSRVVLENQIMSRLAERSGMAPSNFSRVLPAADSELVQQITKDPYNLDFVTMERGAAERQLEDALVNRIERFLRELGQGFSFVGRQYRLDVGGDEFFIDLLMFHADANRYVVIELKSRKLTPGDVGQLEFYVTVVDDVLRRPHHNETVGLLLCASRNERTVRYLLSRASSPLAIATYRYNELPPEERAVLPMEADLVRLVNEALEEG
jgi:predicted nuclease of restriction endonuclease-like (RecB) superfamily